MSQLPSRYAFYAISEECTITWYISPPVDTLNMYDREFINKILSCASAYFDEPHDKKVNTDGTCKHAAILSCLQMGSAAVEDMTIVDWNTKDETVFSDSVTLREGFARLTPQWVIFDDDDSDVNLNLKKFSKANQLLVSQINNWD